MSISPTARPRVKMQATRGINGCKNERERERNARKGERGLCKAKVLAARRHGRVDLLAEDFVAFVFGEVEFCDGCQSAIDPIYFPLVNQRKGWKNVRLKHVCELGKRSLFP